jgi:hypothetical protein
LTLPQQENSELYTYQPHQIDLIWGQVKEHIERGLDTSYYTLEEVNEALKKSEMQLWVSRRGDHVEAAMVTAIHDGYCLLLACGGENLQGWAKYLPLVERWAKGIGFNEMRIYGRRGWLRALPGFKEKTVEMVKKL